MPEFSVCDAPVPYANPVGRGILPGLLEKVKLEGGASSVGTGGG